MADDHLSNPNLSELEWLSLILSDSNRVRTALLRAEYSHHRSQITDEATRIAVEQQYYKLQCSFTPICHLPVEILSKIFYIAFDIGHSRTILMHVCQNWRGIIEEMSIVWTSLKLQARTAPESVQQSLHRAQMHPLVVEIDIGKTEDTVEIPYTVLATAAKSASRWETLTITSLPDSENDARQVDSLHSMDLPPMNQLRHLTIMQSVSSPPLSSLLQNISTFAIGSLASMEIHSSPAILTLIQPNYAPIFGSLTTFKAQLPKMSRPVDLLPHFNQLEILELTNVFLPVNGPQNLPLVHTLRHLYLRAVSIQWMGGRVFPNLEGCTIVSPPMRTYPLLLNVSLPACTTFEIGNKDIVPIRRFNVPNVGSLVVKSNMWSAMRGDEQIVHLFRVVFETSLRPNALHLAIISQNRVLLALLQQLPGLNELRLDLPRSSALGKHFFTQLLAKPVGEIHWKQLRKLRNSKEWKSMICPSLRVLELRYQQWLRQSDCLDFLAPLFAVSQSRERTVTPLKLELHFRSSQGTWRSFKLSSKSPIPISTLEIPLLCNLKVDTKALAAKEKAVTFWRSLSKASDQNMYCENLAIALYDYGNTLHDIGHLEDAARVKWEAVTLFQTLVDLGHEEHKEHLALALNDYGIALRKIGHLEDAARVEQQTVTLYQTLVDLGHAKHKEHLALALRRYGITLHEIGHLEDAARVAHQAVNLYQTLVDLGHDKYKEHLALTLTDYGTTLRKIGHLDDAARVEQLAVTRFQTFVDLGHDENKKDLALALTNYAITLGRIGHLEDAARVGQQAVSLYQMLVHLGHDKHKADLARALRNYKITLQKIGHLEDAPRGEGQAVTL
jgi:tetratricopeptide (TPR) repeat protein